MRTNLVFKRTVNIEGSSRTEMKIIEVNIPELKVSEGWTLVSSADKVEQIKLNEDKPSPIMNRVDDADRATEFLNNLILNVCDAAQSGEEVIHKSVIDSADTGVTGAINSELLTNIASMKPDVYEKVEELKKPELAKSKDEFSRVREFESPVSGTACLIRSRDTIRIAYREGKKANITAPNRICITDRDKQSFFNAVRACNPTSNISKWVLTPKDHHYKWWNEFIDREYKDQRSEFIRKQKYAF